MIVYATLAICALLALLLIYRYDLYEKEPWYMVAVTAAVGAGVMWLLGYLEDQTIGRLGQGHTPIVIATVAASYEEFAKLAIVVAIALAAPKQFNDPMDGIIYGSIAGLGMAVQESVTYMQQCPPPGSLLPPTELVRLLGHPVMGGISGFAVAMVRLRMPRWGIALAGCMAASLTMHFLWDWIALTPRPQGGMRMWQTVAAIALILGGMLLYGILIVIGSTWSRRIFAPGSPRSLWGWPFSLWVKDRKRDR